VYQSISFPLTLDLFGELEVRLQDPVWSVYQTEWRDALGDGGEAGNHFWDVVFLCESVVQEDCHCWELGGSALSHSFCVLGADEMAFMGSHPTLPPQLSWLAQSTASPFSLPLSFSISLPPSLLD
jgi:hypothetical protein